MNFLHVLKRLYISINDVTHTAEQNKNRETLSDFSIDNKMIYINAITKLTVSLSRSKNMIRKSFGVSN